MTVVDTTRSAPHSGIPKSPNWLLVGGRAVNHHGCNFQQAAIYDSASRGLYESRDSFSHWGGQRLA